MMPNRLSCESSMVATLVQLALTNAAIEAVWAGIFWLISRHCRRPQWMYGLWLVVLLKLVTPPLFSVPVPIGYAEPKTELSIASPEQSEVASRDESVVAPTAAEEAII